MRRFRMRLLAPDGGQGGSGTQQRDQVQQASKKEPDNRIPRH